MWILYSEESEQDIVSIAEWLLQFNAESEVRARIAGIRADIKILEKNPNIGTLVKSRVNAETDERYLVCGKYLVFYQVIEKEEKIKITRIADGRQNWQKNIFLTNLK